MITKDQIKHLGKLARLKLNKKEIGDLFKDINKILAYVEKINELNLEKSQPMMNLISKLKMRKDIKKESPNELIINNFPQKEKDYLKVPKIIKKQIDK